MTNNMNVATYLRLSLDDDNKGESASIIGQRELILNYLQSKSDLANCSVVEFSDDGFSGTNFNRPGVIKLLEAVKNGTVNCIIVKDLSRFGRNYTEVGNYLERVFPFLNVRFISINDNYDSNNHKGSTSEIDIAFRNLLYDLYSKDISRKILSSKKMKMEKGDFTSNYAPYGYIKSKLERNKLEIDETSASVVRRIFNDIINGKSTSNISKALNNEGVLTPMQYKKTLGIMRAYNSGSEQNVWQAATVRRILNDERYTGKFVGGKVQSRISNNKRTVLVPKDEWIVVADKHPPIISQEIFERANMMICGTKNVTSSPNSNRLFSKKIRCECCGLLFSRKDQITSYYFCPTSKFADKGCYKGKLHESDLASTLLPIFQRHFDIAVDFKEQIQKQKEYLVGEIKIAEKELQKTKERLVKNESADFELYEKYRSQKLDKNEFLNAKEVIRKLVSDDAESIQHLNQKIENIHKRLDEKCSITERYGTDVCITEVTRDIIDRLVEKIIVNGDGSIDITFTYQDPTKLHLK